jgi:hypothetical protein
MKEQGNVMSAESLKKYPSIELFLKDEQKILSDIEIKEHIFEAFHENESLGYISLYDLKSLPLDQLEGLFIRGYNDSDKILLYSHPFFQRRKPQLISSEALAEESADDFHLLKNGQKIGPFSKENIFEMIQSKEILITDMVSTNNGHTWCKLYQTDDFDRRTLKDVDQLPGLPKKFIGEENESVIMLSEDLDAMTGLAYLSNIKRGKTIEKSQSENQTIEKEKSSSMNEVNSKTVYKIILFASLVGISYFLFIMKDQLSAPFTEKKPVIGEQAEMLTPVVAPDKENGYRPPTTNPSILNNVGNSHFESRVNNQRRTVPKFQEMGNSGRPSQRKSFMESTPYQEVQRGTGGEDDSSFYYDNSAPAELDPVRSQVSRETLNSNLEETGPIPSSDQLFDNEVSN